MLQRTLALLVVPLLVLSAVAAAQGPGDPSPGPRPGQEGRPTPTPSPQGCPDGTEPGDEECPGEAGDDAQRPQRPAMDPRPWFSDPHHIRYEFDEANLTLHNYTVGGVLLLVSATYLGDPAEITVERQGRHVQISFDADTLRLHDTPTGLITFQAGRGGDDDGARGDDEDRDASSDHGTTHGSSSPDNTSSDPQIDGNSTSGPAGHDDSTAAAGFRFEFPADARIQATERGARVHLAGQQAILVAHEAEWSAPHSVRSDRFLSLHLPGQPPAPAAPQATQRPVDGDIQEAINTSRVAAEVRISQPRPALATPQDGVEVQTFDDVRVTVEAPSIISAVDALRIQVDADLAEGRTIVITLDEEMLAGPHLILRYFNVRDDGARTEVVFREASSLQDILDPTDDDGQPEYWIVSDAHGVQLLVSIPHWSIHEIVVNAFAEHLPSIIVGLMAGAFGVAAATAMMFWPRRRREAARE